MKALSTRLRSRLAAQPWKPAMGAGLAIALLAGLKGVGLLPFLIAPLGASATLVWMVPNSPLARARSVIGGSLVSALIGFGVLTISGATPWGIGFAVGLAILAMALLDVLHAPAGALPLVIGINHLEPVSFIATLAFSTILLVVLGHLYRGLTERKPKSQSDHF